MVKKILMASVVAGILMGASSYADSNLIQNTDMKGKGYKIENWTTYSFVNAGEGLSKVIMRPQAKNKKRTRANMAQDISTLTPGHYILALSLSGSEYDILYVVLICKGVDGKEVKKLHWYFDANKLEKLKKNEGWRRIVVSANVPPQTVSGKLCIELRGKADNNACDVMIKNVRLVKQEE